MNPEEEYYYKIWQEKIHIKENIRLYPNSIRYYTQEQYEFILTFAFSNEGKDLNFVITKLSNLKQKLLSKNLVTSERSYYLQEQRETQKQFDCMMKKYSDYYDKIK